MASNFRQNSEKVFYNVPTLFWVNPDKLEELKNFNQTVNSQYGKETFISSKENLYEYCKKRSTTYKNDIAFYSPLYDQDKLALPRAVPAEVLDSYKDSNKFKILFDNFNDRKINHGSQTEEINEKWLDYKNQIFKKGNLFLKKEEELRELIPITIGDVLKNFCDSEGSKSKPDHKTFIENYNSVKGSEYLSFSFEKDKEDKKGKKISIKINKANASAKDINFSSICGMVSTAINNPTIANTAGKAMLLVPNPWVQLAGGIVCTVSAAVSIWEQVDKEKRDIIDNLEELKEIFNKGIDLEKNVLAQKKTQNFEFKYIIDGFVDKLLGFVDLNGEPITFGKDVIIGYFELENSTNKLIEKFSSEKLKDQKTKTKFLKEVSGLSSIRSIGFIDSWESEANDNYNGIYLTQDIIKCFGNGRNVLVPEIVSELGWKINNNTKTRYILGETRYTNSMSNYTNGRGDITIDWDYLKIILKDGKVGNIKLEINEKLNDNIDIFNPILLTEDDYVYRITLSNVSVIYTNRTCYKENSEFSSVNFGMSPDISKGYDGEFDYLNEEYSDSKGLSIQYKSKTVFERKNNITIEFRPKTTLSVFFIDKENVNKFSSELSSVSSSFIDSSYISSSYVYTDNYCTAIKAGLKEDGSEEYISLKGLYDRIIDKIKDSNLFLLGLPSDEIGYSTIDYAADSLISKYTVAGILPYKKEKRNIKIINSDKYYNLLATSTPYVRVGFYNKKEWNYFDSRETPFITSIELNDKGVKTLKLKMFDKDFASYSRIDKNGKSLPSLEQCIREAIGKISYIADADDSKEATENNDKLQNYQVKKDDYNDGRRWEFKKTSEESLSNLKIEFGYTDANQSWASINDEYTDKIAGIKKYSTDQEQTRSHRWWNLEDRYTLNDNRTKNKSSSEESNPFTVFNMWKNRDTLDNEGRWKVDKYYGDSSEKDVNVVMDWAMNNDAYTIHSNAINKIRLKQVLSIQEQSTVGFRPCEFMITKFESNLEKDGISYNIEAVEIKQFKLNNYKIKQRYEVLKGTPVDVLYMLMRIFNEDRQGYATASNVRLFWAEPFSIFNDVEISTDDTGRQVKKPKEITVSLGTQNAYYNWNYESEEKNTRIYYKTIAEILNEFCAACPPLKEANTNVSLKDYNGNEINTEDSSNDIIRPLEWSVGRRAGDSSNDEVCVFLHYRRPTKVNVIREYKWGPGVFGLVSPVENVKIKNKNEFAVLGSIKSFDNFLNKKIERILREPKQAYTSESGEVIEYSRKVEKEDASIIGGVLVNRINGQSTNDKYELAYSNCLYEGEIDLPGDPFYDFDDAMIPFCYPIKFSAYIPVGEAERKDGENTTFGKQSGRSRKHYLSGYYVVKEITHKIDYSGYSTKLKVMSYPGIGRDIGLPEFYNNKNLEKVEDAISEYNSRDYTESNNRLVTTIPIERSPNYKNNVPSTQNKESRIVFGKESFDSCCFMSSLIRGFEDIVHANIMNNVKVAKNAGVDAYGIAKEMAALAKGEKKESSIVFCGLRDDENIKNMIKSYDNYILKSEESFLSSSAFSIVDMFWYSNTRNKYMGSGEEKNYLTSKEDFLNALEEGYAKTQGQKESEYKWKFLESDPLGTLAGNVTDFNADIVIANCTKVDGSGYSVGGSHFVLLDKSGKIIWNSGGYWCWALEERVIYKIQRFNRVKKS